MRYLALVTREADDSPPARSAGETGAGSDRTGLPSELAPNAGRRGLVARAGRYLWKEWLWPTSQAAVVAVVVTTFLFTTVGVVGNSMNPTLRSGERVFVPKYEPWLLRLGLSPGYSPGDIVIFKPPPGTPNSRQQFPLIGRWLDEVTGGCPWTGSDPPFFPGGSPIPNRCTFRAHFIKRVIGVEGDRIRMLEGVVYVNDVALNEVHITARIRPARDSFEEVVVPEGHYFLMGDNRTLGGSEDSRVFGPVQETAIAGRASAVWWPVGFFRVLARPEAFEGAGPGAQPSSQASTSMVSSTTE